MNDGKYSRAFTILRGLLTTDPSNHEARRLLATLLLKFGNLVTAKSAFDSLLQEALQGHDYVEAESLLREYLAVGLRCVPFLEMLGHVYEQQGDGLSAALEYGKAVDVLLEDSDAGQRMQARELYDKIKRLAPSSLVASRLAPVFETAPTLQPEEASEPVGVAEQAEEEPAAPSEEPTDTVKGEPQPFRFAPSWTAEESAPLSQQPLIDEPDLEEEESKESLEETEDGQEPEEYREVGEEEGVEFEEAASERFEDEEKVPFPPVNRMPVMQPPPSLEEVAVPTAEEAVAWTQHETVPESLSQPDQTETAPSAMEVEEPEPAAIASPAPAKMDPEPLALKSREPLLPEPAVEPSLPSEQAPALPSSLEEPAAVATYPEHSLSTEALSVKAEKPIRKQQSDIESPFEPRWNPLASLVRRVSSLIRSTFAALGAGTRLALLLILSVVMLAILAVGFAAGIWSWLEEKPTQAYRELMQVTAPRTLDDPTKNGYFLLLGFGASASLDPVQVGYEHWLEPKRALGSACLDLQGKGLSALRDTPEMRTFSRLLREPVPPERLKAEVGDLKGEIDHPQGYFMSRYRQWLGMPFDDWGYGHLDSPDCARILAIHRLSLIEGFSEGTDKGLDRLETDLSIWRNVLAQAKTLSMKIMAAEAIYDDTVVMSGLLTQPTLESKWLQRLMKWARPLTQDERSLQWPMQSEFLLEAKRVEIRLRSRADMDSPLAAVLAKMPLPKQRVLNGYAGYYDARMKATWSPKSTMPKLYDFARTPARTWGDYLANPFDNLVGGGTIPDWDYLMGVIMETDARLRL
ncbi:MAG: hypothetical protein C4293_14095, partial [Nitrospiraceae bacterium]